jgi:hypothetical protein
MVGHPRNKKTVSSKKKSLAVNRKRLAGKKKHTTGSRRVETRLESFHFPPFSVLGVAPVASLVVITLSPKKGDGHFHGRCASYSHPSNKKAPIKGG